MKTQQVEEMLSTLNSTTRPLSSLINSTNISAFNSTEGNNNNENKKSDNITDKNGMLMCVSVTLLHKISKINIKFKQHCFLKPYHNNLQNNS